jgi:hypothetical protein
VGEYVRAVALMIVLITHNGGMTTKGNFFVFVGFDFSFMKKMPERSNIEIQARQLVNNVTVYKCSHYWKFHMTRSINGFKKVYIEVDDF